MKKIKLNIGYDFSFLLKPFLLLSIISVITYGLKILGLSGADKVFFTAMVIIIIPVLLNHTKNINNKISVMLILFIFLILYLNIYDDLLVVLSQKCSKNGTLFGVMNSVFNTFGLTDFENMIYNTSCGGAKLINGKIIAGAANIFAANQSADAARFLCGRYISLFSALGIAFSVNKHKKAVLFITLFALLTGNLTIYLLTMFLLFTPYYFIFLLFNFISYFIAEVALINGGFCVNASLFELFCYNNNYIYIFAVGFFLCAVSYYFSRLVKERLV